MVRYQDAVAALAEAYRNALAAGHSSSCSGERGTPALHGIQAN
jgi:hypothetical protein